MPKLKAKARSKKDLAAEISRLAIESERVTYAHELRSSFATKSGHKFCADRNAEWGPWAQNIAQSLERGFIESRTAQWECYAPRMAETRLDTDLGERIPSIGIDLDIAVIMNDAMRAQVAKHGVLTVRVRAEITAPKWRSVTRDRRTEFTRTPTGLAKYRNILKVMEFVPEVVLTQAQRDTLAVFGANGWGKLLCSLRRRDTGATALYMREDDLHMVIFEDGSFCKSRHVPQFVGTWFFDKNAERSNVSVHEAAKNKHKANVSEKSFTINRGYK